MNVNICQQSGSPANQDRPEFWTEGEPDVIVMERRIPYEQTRYYRETIRRPSQKDIGKIEEGKRRGLGEREREAAPTQFRDIPGKQPSLITVKLSEVVVFCSNRHIWM